MSHQVSGDEHSALVLLQLGHGLQPLVLTQTTCHHRPDHHTRHIRSHHMKETKNDQPDFITTGKSPFKQFNLKEFIPRYRKSIVTTLQLLN